MCRGTIRSRVFLRVGLANEHDGVRGTAVNEPALYPYRPHLTPLLPLLLRSVTKLNDFWRR